MKTLRGAAAGILLAASAAIVALPATAVANPTDTGCSEGWPLTAVAPLTALGYRSPALVDTAGNNDGYVCARLLPIVICENSAGGPCPVDNFYNFRDNDLPFGKNK